MFILNRNEGRVKNLGFFVVEFILSQAGGLLRMTRGFILLGTPIDSLKVSTAAQLEGVAGSPGSRIGRWNSQSKVSPVSRFVDTASPGVGVIPNL